MSSDIFIWSTVDCPAPEISKLPDISQVTGMDKESAERYATSAGFVLSAVGSKTRPASSKEYSNRTLINADGTKSLPASFYTYMIEGEDLAQARMSINPSIKDFRYTFSTPEESRSKLGPHCDRSRWYSMIFLLSAGGDDHYTAFYREKSTNLIEREFGYHVDDYSQVEEIHRIVIPLNQWVLINARVLHSAENIVGTRVAYHISFDEFPQDLALRYPVYLQ